MVSQLPTTRLLPHLIVGNCESTYSRDISVCVCVCAHALAPVVIEDEGVGDPEENTHSSDLTYDGV